MEGRHKEMGLGRSRASTPGLVGALQTLANLKVRFHLLSCEAASTVLCKCKMPAVVAAVENPLRPAPADPLRSRIPL